MSDEMKFIIDFYQKSWDNLLLVIGGTGVLLGIIWPILVSFLNYKGNDNNKKELERIIEKKQDEIDKHISDSTNKTDEKMKIFESRIVEIERKESILNGNMFFIQAQSASDLFFKIIGLLNAYVSFIEAKEIVSMTMIYTNLSPYLQNNQTIKTTFNTEQLHMVKMMVEKIINGLNQLNDDAYCKYQINIFEDYRNRLGGA
jgi:hypothetical protein